MRASNALKTLGSNQISADQISLGSAFIPDLVFTTSFTPSSTKIFIGGMPLSLAQNLNGQYVLQVVVDNSGSPSNLKFIWGEAFYGISIKNNRNILMASGNGTSNSRPSKTLVYSGIPLSLNSQNYMIVHRYDPKNTADATENIFIGGMPLTVRRYNNNWYLVVHLI